MATFTKATADDFDPLGLPENYDYAADDATWRDPENTRVIPWGLQDWKPELDADGNEKTGIDRYPTADAYYCIYPGRAPHWLKEAVC